MEGLAIVTAAQTHHLAPSTLRVRHYAVRVYCQFVDELKAKDNLFAQYQVEYFPIKKGSFLLFLLGMRINDKYALYHQDSERRVCQ